MNHYLFSINGVFVTKGKRIREVLFENEIRITEEEYDTIELPCKLVDGKYVECEAPVEEENEENEEINEEVNV